jgi:hypothetical protein
MRSKEYENLVLMLEPQDMDKIRKRLSWDKSIRLMHVSLGLSSELAELRAQVDEAQTTGLIDYVNLVEEAGDLAWYTAVAINALELEPIQVWPDTGLNKFHHSVHKISADIDQLVIEIGEFNDILKKYFLYGKDIHMGAAENKITNIAHFISQLAIHSGSDISTVMDINIKKLKARYGDKFTETAALKRNLTKERAILEGK